MDAINRLIHFFSEFPGIGPRQAKRFVYFLLTRDQSYLGELSSLIQEIKKNIRSCASCMRFFTVTNNSPLCSICSDNSRDTSLLMLVSRDVDLETIERSRSYNGYYFVLGGTVPILEKNPAERIRQRELLQRIESKKGILKEIILSMNATSEGENTADYLKKILTPLVGGQVIITILGRGLSTGTELEYSDSDTIVNALKNRG